MPGGLRESWRLQAMRVIQECALDLFDAKGFDSVTIAEVASAADVSPSSIYRYFGTKEGLLVTDEFDQMTPKDLEQLLTLQDPIGSLVAIVQRYEAPDSPEDGAPVAWRRVRYFFEEPS